MKIFYFLTLITLFQLNILGSYVQAQAPTTPSSSLNISNIDGNRFYVSFTRGDGAKRVIIASSQPVTAVPQNGTDYMPGNYGEGNEIAPGQFVVFEGTGSGSWLYGFNHSTTYYLRIYEFNGTDFNTEYLTSEFLEGSVTTLSAPSQQASGVTFSNITGWGMTVSWTNGDGNGRILIGRADEPVNVEPEDLVNYSSSSSFGYYYGHLGDGNYVLYEGNTTSRNITNLDPNRTYHFALFEYNGSNGKVYLKPGATASQATVTKPTEPANVLILSNFDSNRFYYYFNQGNGSRRLVIARKDTVVTAKPVDGLFYTANSTFGSGQEIESGQFVVYDGT
ncbi:MAG: hypothetical protein LC658_14995, partial [Bacteroidales bacterium]|nr:hypothetical protein [Bacteroidales bacterium]